MNNQELSWNSHSPQMLGLSCLCRLSYGQDLFLRYDCRFSGFNTRSVEPWWSLVSGGGYVSATQYILERQTNQSITFCNTLCHKNSSRAVKAMLPHGKWQNLWNKLHYDTVIMRVLNAENHQRRAKATVPILFYPKSLMIHAYPIRYDIFDSILHCSYRTFD